MTWGKSILLSASDFSVKVDGGPDVLDGSTPEPVTNGSVVTMLYTGASSGGMAVTFYVSASPLQMFNVTLSASSRSDEGSVRLLGPHPIMQAFGVPAIGTCDEAASDDLNWSGVSSGGWSESWGRWDGYEGPVCTRTLVYSNSLATWTVS